MYFEPEFSWHQQEEEEEEQQQEEEEEEQEEKDREANKVICCFAGISLTVAVGRLLLLGA